MKSIKIFTKILIVSLLTLLTTGCEDLDDNLKIPNVAAFIQKDSELFQLLERVTITEENPMKDIVCIDFIYPINLQVYNSELEPLYSVTIIGDSNFSAFLSSFPLAQSISISYPITTTLNDGTVFTVNNNAELKLAIDSCSQEDIISYCNGLFSTVTPATLVPCIWKTQYDSLGDNTYLSAYFDINTDGTIKLTYDNEIYNGSWTFFFINSELHLNINLEGTSQIASDWNVDRKVIISGDEIIIQSAPKEIHLKKICQEVLTLPIGATGPAGGIVFYDKGSYSNGWRYIESASIDISIAEWGCFGSIIPDTDFSDIGKGMISSAKILNFHDSLVNYYTNPDICSSTSNGTVAAKQAFEYTQNELNDWFLPSFEELNLMYQNLHSQGIANFSNEIYWSSTQFDANSVLTIDFSSGTTDQSLKNTSKKARAIRYF